MKGKVKVIVDGVPYEVEVEELGVGKFKVKFEGESYEVEAKDLGIPMGALQAPAQSVSVPSTRVAVPSTPTPATPVEVPTAPAPTAAGENEIPSPKDSVVRRILVKEGDTVDTGQALIELG